MVTSNVVFALSSSAPTSAETPTVVGGLSQITNVSQYPGMPQDVAVDGAGNTYFRDDFLFPSRIMRMTPAGAITTYAGTGVYGFSGDGGQAASAQVTGPYDLTTDAAGNLYFIDSSRIRRITTAGVISTVAGNGTFGTGGDGGAATAANLSNVSSIASDGTNLYIGDGNRIRQATIGGNINTISGAVGQNTCVGLPGPLAAGRFGTVSGLTISNGALYAYLSCGLDYRIVKAVAGNWVVFAGGGATITATDGATSTSLRLNFPYAFGSGPGDTVYASVGAVQLLAFNQGGTVTVVAGDGVLGDYIDGAAAATIPVAAFAVNPASADVILTNPRIGRLGGGTILDVLGASSDPADGVPANSVVLPWMTGMAVDANGIVYFASGTSARIRSISTAGILGSKGGGGADDPPTYGAPANQSALFFVRQLDTTVNGELQFILQGNVAKIDGSGILRRVAGNGVVGNGPDGGQADATSISPVAITSTNTGQTLILSRMNPSGVALRTVSSTGVIGTMYSQTDNFFSDLAAAPDGTVVLAPGTGDKLIRVATNGTASDIAFPAGIGTEPQIVVDPAGNIFMLRETANTTAASLVKIAPNGTSTEIDNPAPGTLDLDAAGNLYVGAGDKVLKYSLIAAPEPAPIADQVLAPLSPVRLFDTRPSEAQGAVTVDKHKYGGPDNILRVKVTGVGGVPTSGVGAVSLNVTVNDPAGAGFVTVYPCGDRPNSSNLNYIAGQTVPNAVLTPVSASGEVCLFSHADAHLIADINGWFAS